MEIYKDWSQKYYDSGYVPIPIKLGTKRPQIYSWSTFCEEKPTAEVLADWQYEHPRCGLGVTCGKASNLVVFDYDNDLSTPEKIALHKLLEDHFPKSPIEKKGKRGFSGFFRYSGEKSTKISLSEGSIIFEILSDGKQCVLPPSIHPDLGKPFRWIGKEEKSLCEIESKDLPPLNTEVIENLTEIIRTFEGHVPKEKGFSSSVSGKIKEPGRNTYLTSIAGSLHRKGIPEMELKTILLNVNKERCEPPIPDEEVASIAKSICGYPSKLSWSKPKDLPALLQPVDPLTKDLIPPSLQPWISDITYQMNVPPDMVLIPALVLLGSLIGIQVGIKPWAKDGSWTQYANLWGALVMRSGQMKSPVLSQVSKPLEKIISKARKKFEADVRAFTDREEDIDIEKDIKKKELKSAFAEKTPDLSKIKKIKEEISEYSVKKEKGRPDEIRYRINDGTIEKIGEILSKQNKTLLIYRDELTGLIQQCSKPGRESDRGFLLESWSNSRNYVFERISRGTVHIKYLSLSVLGGIQPSKLSPIIKQAKDGTQDDGLIQRFSLLSYPDLPKTWSKPKRKSNWVIREEMNETFEKIIDLKVSGFKAKEDHTCDTRYKSFSEDAQGLFEDWFEKLEKRIRSDEFIDYPAFESHMAKYRGLVPSLALIYDVLEFSSGSSCDDVVGEPAINWAIRFSQYLETHARRAYGYTSYSNLDGAHALLKKINKGNVSDGDSVRDIYRHHWKDLDSPDKAEQAISILEDYGWLKIEKIGSGGRPSEVLRINPMIFKSTTVAKEL